MSLPAVDENWYCEDCDLNFEYCDKPDFLFCPNCGKVLKNDMYQYNLDGLIDSLNNLGKSICENCGEEFDKEYNFCPLCSEKLKKETIPFDIEKTTPLLLTGMVKRHWYMTNVFIYQILILQ